MSSLHITEAVTYISENVTRISEDFTESSWYNQIRGPAPIPNAENIDIAALLNATRFHGQAREGAL